MFTGIVEELGHVVSLAHGPDSAVVRIRGPLVTADAAPGASIAVNGICLTVVELDADSFCVDVMAETLRRTCLGELTPGSPVNLERALAVGDRLGGHIVQGHVDGTGTILARQPGDRWEVVTISLPGELARYVVEKGSVTVDGVSLTVVEPLEDGFTVAIIPHTAGVTTLGHKQPGDPVNIEVDVVAKYIESLLPGGPR